MKKNSWMKYAFVATVLALASAALALDGQFGIHDPSTVVLCDGKYYVWGTGGTPLVSDDGWTWRAGVRPTRTGAAPDVIHIGDKYFMYIAGGSPMVGGTPSPSRAHITMIWSKTLDPNSPDYKWEDGGEVASSNGVEDCNAIDPGAFLDPTTGKLWLTYGSYIGYIRLVQLDPKTGKRVGGPTDKPIDVAINMEASDMFYHDGWYYLLGTHGSCCRSADSGYNIRVGRSRKVTGPFVDDNGIDLIEGGGKLLIGSGGRVIGAGHFGLLDIGDGVQKFSMHWEADLDRGGASVLDIRPLLWRDGWPVAGENAKAGTYEIESVRTGTALELAVEGVPVGGARGGRGGGRGARGARGAPGGQAPPSGANGPTQAAGAGGRGADVAPGAPAPAAGAGAQGAPGGGGFGGGGMFGGTGTPIPDQDVKEVSANWPAGNIDPRMANYMNQAQQKWTVTPVAGAGGYPGSPYFKITIAGTDRALAATADAELVVLPAFTGRPEQLWRLDQLADGSYRIMPKLVPNYKQSMALSAVGSSFATLSKFDPASNKHHWLLKTP
jgi:arabinan endo-1,5-alpha-L-arabinosidase